MMFGIGILWILLIGLIVWGVKVFIDYSGNHKKNNQNNKTAIDILRERYARGEIDKQEFEEHLKLLND